MKRIGPQKRQKAIRHGAYKDRKRRTKITVQRALARWHPRHKLHSGRDLSSPFECRSQNTWRLRRIALVERRRVLVDFRTLKEIGPCASLVLAAELDRWRRLGGFRPQVKDVDKWDPNVLQAVSDMGLFSLLDVVNYRPPRNEDGPVKFLPFLSSRITDGSLARKLRLSLEDVLGPLKTDSSQAIYKILTEAMQNAVSHAYRSDIDPRLYACRPIRRTWWMSALTNSDTELVSIIFLDQGFGIPVTMRLTNFEAYGILARRVLRGKPQSSSIIEIATRLGRTGTTDPGRGRGLSQMKDVVRGFGGGSLRILSSKGEYVFCADGTERLTDHDRGLGGTLIEWVFPARALS